MLALLLAAVVTATADQSIVLDDSEKHIVRTAFHEDEAVALSGNAAGGWHLYAGAAIDAQRIDLTMRNVKGTVRFRADSTRARSILDHIERQYAAPPPR